MGFLTGAKAHFIWPLTRRKAPLFHRKVRPDTAGAAKQPKGGRPHMDCANPMACAACAKSTWLVLDPHGLCANCGYPITVVCSGLIL